MLKRVFIYLVVLSKFFSRQNLNNNLLKEVEILNKKNTKNNILNIGAGGELSKIVKMITNGNLVNIDIDENRAPDMVMDATDLKFENESFDAIFLMEVLEHISEPQLAISEIYRTLKKDGLLVMSSPFVFGLHDKPYDFFRYTKYGLAYLLKDFSDVKIVQRNDYVHTIIVLVARLMKADANSDKIIGAILFVVVLILYPFLWVLSKLIKSDNISTGYFVLAVK